MPSFYLTPASIGYLTQFILSLLITAYLARRFRRRENRSAQAVLLVGFFVSVTGFIGLLFLDAALLPAPRLLAVYLENAALAISLVFLLQFSYHFPELPPRLKREAWIALAVSGVYAILEIAYAVYRFSLLADGQVIYRSTAMGYPPVVGLLWVPIVLLRQSVYASIDSARPVSLVNQLRSLWRPQGKAARAAQALALVYLLPFVLGVANVLASVSKFMPTAYQLSMSFGILLTLLLFVFIYLNDLPETNSFMVKLVGTALVISLAVLSAVGWVIAPVYASTFSPALPGRQTLRFTPNTYGGYDVSAAPFQFDPDWGDRLEMFNTEGPDNPKAMDFPFPFFGQTYSQIFVDDNGTVGIGKVVDYRAIQANYGIAPAIYPLYLDLMPESGGVYARQTASSLVVTWEASNTYHPEARFTFQLTLHPDGVFEVTYDHLPADVRFFLDDKPEASVWLVGALPGNLSVKPQLVDFFAPAAPVQGGPQGFIQDFYLAFRQYLHRFLLPLLYLILANSLLIGLGIPFLMRLNVVKPLKSLMTGLEKVEGGDLNVELPIQYRDEIGSLTTSFNAMTTRLRVQVTNLEEHVAERTQELQSANDHLHAEIGEREAAQAQIIQQQRTLAALEERERLGRELHDGLGQVMGSINVQTQAAQALLNDGQTEATQANLERVVQMAQDAHSDIRNFILGLRAPATVEASFFHALEEYLGKFHEETGVQASLSLPAESPSPAFTPAVEEQVLHVIQEALANVRKHAAARMVEVLFSFDARQAQMVISDDGIGFDPRQKPGDGGQHFGLSMMRERLEMVGGRLEVRSEPGQGTKVLASIPRPGSVPALQFGMGGKEGQGLRILLVDDSPIFLEGLRNLLMARGLTVVGLAHDGLEAQEKARLLRPDIIVMDVEMPGCNGLEATQAIKAGWPEAKIVMLSVSEDEGNLFEAIKSGASGYLLKNLDANAFIELLSGLARGETPLTPSLAARLLAEYAHPAAPGGPAGVSADELSDRQWQILDLAAHGLAYKEIGTTLNLSEATIKYHMKQILERLHLESRAQAVAHAKRVGKKK
jgi:signal transduction histidine kinase/DNA-binding NarL/FixJ family response regulator